MSTVPQPHLPAPHAGMRRPQPPSSAPPEFYMIGDCRQNGNMRNAIRDAYALAMRI